MKLIDPFTFEIDILVQASGVDELGHVNHVVYLDWVQRVAAAHWNQVAPIQMQNDCIWVVVRHEIDYYKSAMPGDKIKAHTWIESYHAASTVRAVKIFLEETNEVLIQSKTTWCLLDPQNMRPKRISTEIKAALPLKPSHA
ncbi:MAG TPA: thioesterase family protein [Cyclobacteriaceae bacterium]|nr:thioesterase family protein [Cyclobacteriaceae bacterium]